VPSLPKVHVPVVVTTQGVDDGLKKAEAKIRASAKRMEKIQPTPVNAVVKSAAQGAFSLGGFGALGAVAGAAGPAGIALAGAVAPIAAAGKIISVLSEVTKGATAALDDFRKTGIQTAAANSLLLERFSIMENQIEKTTRSGFFEGLVGASADVQTGRAGGLAGWAQQMTEGLTIAGAAIGAFTSGKSLEQIKNEMALSVANEGGAYQIGKAIAEQARIESIEGGSGGMLGTIGQLIIEANFNLKSLVEMGR